MANNRFSSSSHHSSSVLSPFDSLFTYIQKNTALKDALAQVDQNEEQQTTVLALDTVIKNGNFNSDVFNDPDCSLYLLQLMRTDKIDFWHGMSVYVYLLALLQFSDKQPFKQGDEYLKMQREMTVANFCQDGELTVDGRYFAKKFADSLMTYTLPNCYEEFCNFVKKLPPSEGWLIKITEVTHNRKIEESNKISCGFDRLLMHLNKSDIPFLPAEQTSDDKYFFYFPSFSIINFCLQKISAEPLKIRPIFGSVTSATLANLHKNGEHPLPIYSSKVKSNLAVVHSVYYGPFSIILHDIAHNFWGSFLPITFRQKLYSFLIPKMEELEELAKQHDDNEVAKLAKDIKYSWNDYDLSETSKTSVMERISKYLEAGFHFAGLTTYTGNFKIGKTKYDRFYFLVESIKAKQSHRWAEDEILYWNELINVTQKLVARSVEKPQPFPLHFYQQNTLTASKAIKIEEVIQHLAALPIENKVEFADSLNKQAWIDLLTTEQDEAKLWETLTSSKYYEDFLMLLKTERIKFFPHYLSLTSENRRALIEALREIHGVKSRPYHSPQLL